MTTFSQPGPAQVRRARVNRTPTRNAALSSREAAYRANNFGVALLEQFRHREAADEFRRALRLDPRNALARINLAIALYNVPDIEGAVEAARAAIEVAPRAPQPHYILGLIAKNQNRADDAVGEFKQVLAIDPDDTGANVLLGQIYLQQRDFKEANALFRRAVEAEPYNGTALYNLATALLRAGSRDEGGRVMERFQALRASGAATIIGQNYLEQGRYAEAVTSTGAEADLVDKRMPDVVFTDVTASVLPPFIVVEDVTLMLKRIVGGVTLFDYDGDGDLDLFEAAGRAQRLLRNDAGKFTDVTAQAGALAIRAEGVTTGVIAGDYDNDGREDLFVLRYGANRLYHNEGGGRFSDATVAARITEYKYLSRSAAFFDCDHDGDLDIFIAGAEDSADFFKLGKSLYGNPLSGLSATAFLDIRPAPSLLLRNNGDATFTDQTAAAKLGDPVKASAVVPTDYDNRRDVDLLMVSRFGMPTLWRNMRDGTFRNVGGEVGLNAKDLMFISSVAAGDVNKDSYTDFYFGQSAGPGRFALSDGKGRFRIQDGPTARVSNPTSLSSFSLLSNDASQFIDYDNDGLLDLLMVVTTGGGGKERLELLLARSTGDGWADVSDKATRGLRVEIGSSNDSHARSRLLAAGDLDGDGDTDIIFGIPGGGLRVARNDGGSRNASVRVRLAGKVSNRSGVGAKIEVRAGSLQQKLETYSATPAPAPADVNFGLGRRASADAVRVIWPSGVVQAETQTATREGAQTLARVRPGALKVTELDRKPSSCPYLYTWNGSRFEFVTDFMGGGEMGAWVAPGLFNTPDPDEYVRIRGAQLKERDGRYELRVTNELEEALFVDRLQLLAVAHPAEVEAYPNEGLGNPTGAEFKLYATRNTRPPRAAHDEHGHDVLSRIARLDRKYADDFALLPVRGYAGEHALTLDLGNESRPQADGRMLLLMTGWTDYAFSSDNVAAAQRGFEMKPPALQVRDEEGNWQTVVENIGIPVGRPQTVTVDLTGKFLSESREVRVVTNMRVYWDRVLVDDSAGDAPLRVERLEAVGATLRERGFSAEVTPDGREPFGYDYARVSLSSPWKAFPGRYTRFGDVRELLSATDDMFVISRPGDELALSFDARALGPLPTGWTRTFLLYADGFSKEMDINSASPHELAPLPFHGMKSYPYAAPESYPADEAHRSYIERYNTRVVPATVPRLVISE
ncbi:MAG: VCBS repeat-containing protein [Rubrivivax sp.]|nr:VCBS repeat-containing protein [Pyrinomonadaceae bacterium]